jgi:hypothetical protein
VAETFAAIAAISELTGFAPTISLDEGIPRFVAWFRAWHGLNDWASKQAVHGRNARLGRRRAAIGGVIPPNAEMVGWKGVDRYGRHA